MKITVKFTSIICPKSIGLLHTLLSGHYAHSIPRKTVDSFLFDHIRGGDARMWILPTQLIPFMLWAIFVKGLNEAASIE